MEDIPESDEVDYEANDEEISPKTNGESKKDADKDKGNDKVEQPESTDKQGLNVDEVKVEEARMTRSGLENGGATMTTTTTQKSPPLSMPGFGEKNLLHLPAIDEDLVRPGPNSL